MNRYFWSEVGISVGMLILAVMIAVSEGSVWSVMGFSFVSGYAAFAAFAIFDARCTTTRKASPR